MGEERKESANRDASFRDFIMWANRVMSDVVQIRLLSKAKPRGRLPRVWSRAAFLIHAARL